jgi:demethylmenaquinone methyltransferase/2-methoxy-6-polyprenyl-1,4-benzoquinol methylase
MAEPRPAGRTAADGSPYPDRSAPEFEREVRRMFTHIAERYDWFDHVASLGNDFLWRPRAFWDLQRFRADDRIARILDVGCGTGDLARLAARRFPRARVSATDFTPAMLSRARARTRGRPEAPRLDFARATGLKLPFADGTFDLVTNAFVARNLKDLDGALREFRRVLRPGGSLLTLEITEPVSPRFGAVFHAYFDRVVPWLGAAVASAGPYRYLPESLRTLPPRSEFMARMRAAGFGRVDAVPQSLGIVTTFLAEAGAPGPAADQSR